MSSSFLPRFVKEIMTTSVVTVNDGATIPEAAKIMSDRGVGCLVVKREEKVVGILTERDIVVRAIARDVDLSATKVEDIMSKEVVVCSPNMRIVEVAKIMGEKKIRRLPVIDEGKLVGIVTAYDVAVYGWGMPPH
jgi:CBS domain-containing protein